MIKCWVHYSLRIPPLVFRGATSLRNLIAPNIINPPKRSTFFHNMEGFLFCKRWSVSWNDFIRDRKLLQFSSTQTSHLYAIWSFISCHIRNVVYMLHCPCGLQHVGCTIRKLHIGLEEHIENIKHGFQGYSVSKHYAQSHNEKPAVTIFLVIDKHNPHWRGLIACRDISCLETRWIYDLKCFTPFGLIIEWDINCFFSINWDSLYSY